MKMKCASMTDNDIKKALECCSSENGKDDCLTCPNFKDFADCKEDLSAIALDLINRQQAEIEKLNVELVGMRGACESYKMHYDNAQAEIERLKKALFVFKNNSLRRIDEQGIKSEAIKEFAERLKEKVEKARKKYQRLCKEQGDKEDEIMNIHFNGMSVLIDNLVKEMTESPIKIEHSSLCETETYEVKE